MPIPSPSRRAGTVSRQMVMTIGLVIVIGASLVYTWSQLFGGSATPPKVVELGFKCTLPGCETEFSMTNEDFQARTPDREFIRKTPGRTIDMVDCPRCGQKHSALQMHRCPECGKFFLPSKVNIRTAPPGYVPPDPVCPHCGTNMNKWHREHNS